MDRYLLGTQSLVEVASENQSNEVFQWAERENVALSSVFASVMSFEIFRSEVDRQEGVEREVWDLLFDQALRKFEAKKTILPVTLDIALRSAALNRLDLHTSDPDNGELSTLDGSNQLVAATALVERLILVDRRQPYHTELEKLGLVLVDPYA